MWGWFPELVDAKVRSRTHDAIEVHRELISEMLTTNTASTVHQRLRDEHGLGVGISSFRRYIWREFPEENLRNIASPPRPDIPAGEEAQIDYGYLGKWFDPVSQKMRRVWAFVMVLAFSRHMFVRPVLVMDQRTWTACHVAAFQFFGAVPARLVSDNLKTGVIKADIYDPLLNRSYAELAEHYGCLIDPASALKPKDKPRVERQMPYVRDSMWRGHEWLGSPRWRPARSLVHRGRRRPITSLPRRSGPAVGLSDTRARKDGGAAVGCVRVGELEPPQGRDRLPCQGRQNPLHRAVEKHRPPARCPRRRSHRGVLPQRCDH